MSINTIDDSSLAYGAIAPHYDALTATYPHDRWMAEFAALARRHGLGGGPVLDVACGTGKSVMPLLDLGFNVVGCDFSSEMLEVARRSLPDVTFQQADMRALPANLGRFAWATCINDALNCLLGDGELAQALGSIAARLCPGGVLTFDLNSRRGHEDAFTTQWFKKAGGAYMCWQGLGVDEGGPHVGRSELSVFAEVDADMWRRTVSVVAERYWSADDVRLAAADAGLDVVAVHGQRKGCVIDAEVDEAVHTKVIYCLRRPSSGNGHC